MDNIVGIGAVCVLIFATCFCIIAMCCKRAESAEQRYLIEQFTQPVLGKLLTVQINSTNECEICLEIFSIGETTRVLECGHYYHQSCIDPWLGMGKKCPKCGDTAMV